MNPNLSVSTFEASDVSNWPDSLVAIARAIGPEAAVKLVNTFGGLRKTYIPRRYTPGHTWAKHIGEEAFEGLCRAFGGQMINVPRGTFGQLKKRAVLELAEKEPGLSRRQIALRAQCTEGYVQTILRKG